MTNRANINKILVATDLSPCSAAALDHADRLAAALGATLDVLYVWNYTPVYAQAMAGAEPPDNVMHSIEQAAQDKLARFVDAAEQSGVTIHRSLLRPGKPASEIIQAATDGGYDLIVTGTHGRRGVARMFLGSVAEHVVRAAPCPVLTVHPA